MDILDEELLLLWKEFEINNFEYIIVGGFATNLNGYSRMTADLDVLIKNSLSNRKILRAVLKNLGHGDYPFVETSELVPGWTSIKLTSGFELDIMTSIKGFDESRFDELYNNASIAEIQNIKIPFLHINNLIEAKKASGRTRDLLDLEELIKIRNQNEH